jgi:hypothetical protein
MSPHAVTNYLFWALVSHVFDLADWYIWLRFRYFDLYVIAFDCYSHLSDTDLERPPLIPVQTAQPHI